MVIHGKKVVARDRRARRRDARPDARPQRSRGRDQARQGDARPCRCGSAPATPRRCAPARRSRRRAFPAARCSRRRQARRRSSRPRAARGRRARARLHGARDARSQPRPSVVLARVRRHADLRRRLLRHERLHGDLRAAPAARIFTYDPPLNRRSERRLAELKPKLVLFGHGPPLREPAKLEGLRRRAAGRLGLSSGRVAARRAQVGDLLLELVEARTQIRDRLRRVIASAARLLDG